MYIQNGFFMCMVGSFVYDICALDLGTQMSSITLLKASTVVMSLMGLTLDWPIGPLGRVME